MRFSDSWMCEVSKRRGEGWHSACAFDNYEKNGYIWRTIISLECVIVVATVDGQFDRL